MEALFYVGVILVLGAIMQWLSPKLKLPRIVGYLLLGLFIGPEMLGLVPKEFVSRSHIITDLALSVIAVLVGATLKLSTLKGHGKEVLYITLSQSLSTYFVVVFGFVLLGEFMSFPHEHIILTALLLAGIATATDTAAPIAIVRELRAKGSFTSTFLAVIAIDDAISLIIFTLSLTLGTSLIGSGVFEWMNITDAVLVIVLSSALGGTAALVNSGFERFVTRHKGMETVFTLGLIFIVYSLSEYWGLEPLLSAMVMGAVMTNTSGGFDLVEEEIDRHMAEIIFMFFFILSAMHLEFSPVLALPVAIEAYVVFRFFGKYMGSYLGAMMAGSSRYIRHYMGLALFPQAGVAIGLALSLQKHEGLELIAPSILNIVIATTLIHELFGPLLTEYVIKKSTEAGKNS